MRDIATCAGKMLFAILGLFAAISPEGLFAGVGEWTSNGPDGAVITALATDPFNPSTVYAATPRRLYKSDDGGGRWTATGLSGSFDLIVPTSAPSTVYASRTENFDAPFFRTPDGGESWVSLAGPRGRLVSVTGDPHDPMTLYATTYSGLFRTVNGGESWEPLTNPAPGRIPRRIVVDPDDSGVLYAAFFTTSEPSVYRSSDRGATWRQTGLREPVRDLLVDPRNPSRLLALTAVGLQETTNRGDSWQRLARGTESVTRLAIDPTDSSRLYMASLTVLLRSTDGGRSVAPVSGDFGAGPRAIATLGSALVLVGSDLGVSRSEDAGGTWTLANPGIREVLVKSLALDPANPAVVFAAGDRGISESRDGGETWHQLESQPPGAGFVAIDPSDPSTLYAAGTGGVDKSTDGGRTWRKTLVDSIADLVIDPSNPRRVLAGYARLYRSLDGAGRWDTVITPEDDYAASYYPPRLSAIRFAPSDSSTVYAAGSGDTSFIYRSGDGGGTWSDPTNVGSLWVSALEVHSCDPQTLQAGGWGGVRRSLDGGNTWSENQLAGGPVFTFARDPRHSASVFAGTSQGVFWTNDRGATWTRFGPALDESVHSIALDPSGRILYAGTERGVFTLERTFEACRDGPDRLCLAGAKYQVTVTARNPRTGAPVVGHAIAEGDQFGYFSFPDVTGDPNLPEVFVKMVDATGAAPPYGGYAWVFHASLTDLAYTVTVLETGTGRLRTYPAVPSITSLTCGTADTSAFVRACGVEESAAPAAATNLAAGSGAELSLLGGRFRVSLRATDPRTGRNAEGAAIPRADGFGYFGLPAFTGDPTYPEVFVKMVDGRSQPGGAFWVFQTGLTDLDYTLTVTDTVTGASRTYLRADFGGSSLCGSADTAAFRD